MTERGFRVTLLGTGVPIPSPDRFGPCTLVEAGGQKFLIDAGRGATIRLYQLKLPIGRIDAQLLTHYHSDHTSGVGFNGIRHRRDSLRATISIANSPSTRTYGERAGVTRGEESIAQTITADRLQQQETECFRLGLRVMLATRAG